MPDSFRRLDSMCKIFPDIPRIWNVVNQEVEILYPNTWNPKLFAGVDGECLESEQSTFVHDPSGLHLTLCPGNITSCRIDNGFRHRYIVNDGIQEY